MYKYYVYMYIMCISVYVYISVLSVLVYMKLVLPTLSLLCLQL